MGIETHGCTEEFAFVICSGNINKYDFVFSVSTSYGQHITPEIIFIYIYKSKNQSEKIKSSLESPVLKIA